MFRHQYSSYGQHRIVKLDHLGFLLNSGHWVGYNNIASMKLSDSIEVIAVSDYFSEGNLKPDVLYEVSVLREELNGGSENIQVRGE